MNAPKELCPFCLRLKASGPTLTNERAGKVNVDVLSFFAFHRVPEPFRASIH